MVLMRPSVLMIGSEAVPFAKTGGLADVLGALPPALARLGWDATVALPRYRGVTAGTLIERVPVSVGGFTREVGLFDAPLSDAQKAVVLLTIESDAAVFQTRAKTIHSTPNIGVGVTFLDQTPESQPILNRWLHQAARA